MTTMNNRLQLIGNVGNDPEIKNLEGNKKVAVISIATTSKYKNDSGETVTDTQWHRVSAWGKNAEIIEKYVVKGTKIGVEAKLTYRTYEDKNGIKQYITEITAGSLQLFGK